MGQWCGHERPYGTTTPLGVSWAMSLGPCLKERCMEVLLESSHASMPAAPVDTPAVLGLAQIPGSALQGCCAVPHARLSLAWGW
eukprot:8604700-Pyramimonas_sp.AAC.1